MKLSSYLLRLQRLLSRPGAWIQGPSARDKSGLPTEPSDPDACKFCLVGGILRVTGLNKFYDGAIPRDMADVLDEVAKDRGSLDALHFNEVPGRRQEEVVRLIDAARARLRRRGQ